MAKKKKYYAVRNTNQIFEEWSDCERVVKGTKGVEYKSFPTREQAEAYLRGEEPVLSTKKTSEIVPYVSESGIRGTIRMAEDSAHSFGVSMGLFIRLTVLSIHKLKLMVVLLLAMKTEFYWTLKQLQIINPISQVQEM